MACNPKKKKRGRLFSVVLALAILGFCSPAIAEETLPLQEIKQEETFLNANIMKQPQEKKGKQLIENKKSFLFINIVINGKCPKVKQNEIK